MSPDETGISAESRAMFTSFRYLVQNAVTMRLVVRGFGNLQGSWDYFAAMTAPSPPTWWRYGDNTLPNQAMIKDLPPLDFGSELFMHHCARDRSRNPATPERIDPMARYDVDLPQHLILSPCQVHSIIYHDGMITQLSRDTQAVSPSIRQHQQVDFPQH